MSDQLLLDAKNISKRFAGVLALDKVNFQLERGSVHAICGENGAGKSTLMKILMGVYQRDEGDIFMKGTPVDFSSPKHALHNGISMIEQELNPVLDMTVAENMFLGREPVRSHIFVNFRQLNQMAAQVLNDLNMDIPPDCRTALLSLAEKQLVEIAKAISYDSEVIIMDEPTSAIGGKEVKQLFEVIHRLKNQGKGIIYVSHKLDEVFSLADKITVLRDGKYTGTWPTDEIDQPKLIRLMVGREYTDDTVKCHVPEDTEILRVEKFCRHNSFKDISFKLKKSEVLGIFGLMGSGRSDLLDAMFGVTRPDSGDIYLDAKRVKMNSPAAAIRNGLAYVTEDRKDSGLVLTSSVRENISLASLRNLSDLLFINRSKETRMVKSLVKDFRIKTSSLRQLALNLSGGNQQKVVLSRWLMTKPRILLFDEPTRGIDVGAKREIYEFISRYAHQGAAAIVVSSELPELMTICDRILVFKRGSIVAEFETTQAHQDNILKIAS